MGPESRHSFLAICAHYENRAKCVLEATSFTSNFLLFKKTVFKVQLSLSSFQFNATLHAWKFK